MDAQTLQNTHIHINIINYTYKQFQHNLQILTQMCLDVCVHFLKKNNKPTFIQLHE